MVLLGPLVHLKDWEKNCVCCVDVYWGRGVSSRQKGGGGMRDGHDYSNTLSHVNLYFLVAENDGKGGLV